MSRDPASLRRLSLVLAAVLLACSSSSSNPASSGDASTGSVTLAQACASLATSECTAVVEACSPDYGFPSQADCLAAYELLCATEVDDLTFLLGPSVTPANLKACFDGLGSVGTNMNGGQICVETAGLTLASLVTKEQAAIQTCDKIYARGSVATGGSCLVSGDCTSGFRCVHADAGATSDASISCGTCAPALQAGQACDVLYDCDDTKQLYCVENTCQRVAQGAPCGSTNDCTTAAGVFSSLYCDPTSMQCEPSREQGQACTSSSDCDMTQLLVCMGATGSQTCQPIPLAFDSGSSTVCSSTGSCKPDAPTVGQSCAQSGGKCWQSWCGSNVDGGPPICNAYGIIGTACAGNAQCAQPLSCVNGQCGAPAAPSQLPTCQ